MIITLEQWKAAKKLANQKFGGRNGYRIDEIILTETWATSIALRVSPGYRKYTTGEYVPNAYRRNFGWKNTYYQTAFTSVFVNVNDVKPLVWRPF